MILSAHLHLCPDVQKLPSRVSAVQALVLSAYFDVGVGAMASAWHASGLALRTALDIGLNRPVDEWVTPEGTRYFTKSQVETCRRVWYGVLLLEKYVPPPIVILRCFDDSSVRLIAMSQHTLDGLLHSTRMTMTRHSPLMTLWTRRFGKFLSQIMALGLAWGKHRTCPSQGGSWQRLENVLV